VTSRAASAGTSVALAVGRVAAWSTVLPQASQRSGGAVCTFPQKQAMVQLIMGSDRWWTWPRGVALSAGFGGLGVRRFVGSIREVQDPNPRSELIPKSGADRSHVLRGPCVYSGDVNIALNDISSRPCR